MSKNLKERIAELQKEQEQLKARAQQLQIKYNAAERKTATHRKVVLGALVLKDIETNETVRKYIIRLLATAAPRDKNLFVDLLAVPPSAIPAN
jgi:hypothetical protein